jgi:hypothetical protein
LSEGQQASSHFDVRAGRDAYTAAHDMTITHRYGDSSSS